MRWKKALKEAEDQSHMEVRSACGPSQSGLCPRASEVSGPPGHCRDGDAGVTAQGRTASGRSLTPTHCNSCERGGVLAQSLSRGLQKRLSPSPPTGSPGGGRPMRQRRDPLPSGGGHFADGRAASAPSLCLCQTAASRGTVSRGLTQTCVRGTRLHDNNYPIE